MVQIFDLFLPKILSKTYHKSKSLFPLLCFLMDEKNHIHTIPGRAYDSNIYLIAGTHPAIIDTGTGRYTKEVLAEIDNKINIRDIEAIILTHEHFDHIGGAIPIKKATENTACIYAIKKTAEHTKQGVSPFAKLLNLQFKNFSCDQLLDPQKEIVLGDHPYKILPTPGHSKGSVCLYQPELEVLFSGDTVFTDGNVGRTDLPGGSITELMQSIESLTHLNIKSLYPGHGTPINQNGDTIIQRAYEYLLSYY